MKWEATDDELVEEHPAMQVSKPKPLTRSVKARVNIQDLPDDESSSNHSSEDDDYVDEYRRAKRNQRTVSLYRLENDLLLITRTPG